MSKNDNISLKQKAAKSMYWTAIQKYSHMVIQFVLGIILARLLTPHDYGCIGMLTIFMSLAEAFIEGGFGSALIQKKNPTQDDYSTIFFWNIGVAGIMYSILFFCAPLIADFYSIPLLCPVLRVQALVLFVYAFNIVQRNQLRKTLNFKMLAIVTLVTSLASFIITVIMAYMGFGVWSLVAQNLITASIPALLFWFYVGWRPIWTFSSQSFKELFNFGFFMFLTHILNQFCKSIQTMLIGKMYSANTLGFYSKAMKTESLASSSISSIMTSVTYPLYAKVQDDQVLMQKMIKRLTQTIAYLTFPLMFILILIAKPLFILLYSDRWLQSIPYFQVLCLVGISSCLQAVNSQTIAAIGKSKILFLRTLLNRTVGLVFMIGGLYFYGMKGFLVGVVIYNYWCYGVNISLVSRYIGYKWYNQLKDLMSITIVTLISFGIAMIIGYSFNLSLYLDGLLKMFIFIAVYLGWSFLVKPEEFRYVQSIIPKKNHNRKSNY